MRVSDPAKGNDRLRANSRLVHLAHRIQPARRGENFVRKCSAGCDIAIELSWRGGFSGLRRVHRCRARVLFFRQTDPKIETKRFAETLSPIFRQRDIRKPPDQLAEKKSECAGVITAC